MSPRKVRKTSRVSVDSTLLAEVMKLTSFTDKERLREMALKVLIASAPAKRKRVST